MLPGGAEGAACRRRRVAARVRQAGRGVRPERHAVAVARGEALLETRVPERSRAARARRLRGPDARETRVRLDRDADPRQDVARERHASRRGGGAHKRATGSILRGFRLGGDSGAVRARCLLR